MKKDLVFYFAVLLLVLPFASATIFLPPVAVVYNYGDTLKLSANIIPSADAQGQFIADLKCGNSTINIFNQFYELSSGQEQIVAIITKFIHPALSNISSSCFVQTTFNGETTKTKNFKLSRLINIDANLKLDNYMPKKEITISGTATKQSGVPVDGNIEIEITGIGLYKSGTVSKGVFNITIQIPANAKSGAHNITLRVTDSDNNGKIISSGEMSGNIGVLQELKDFNIVLINEEAKPSEDFIFRVSAIDQAGDLINREVSSTITEPKGLAYIKKIIKSNEDQIVPFSLNNTPGYWAIEVLIDGQVKRKLFYLTEVAKIQTSLIEDTLYVTNIGNTLYDKPVEITIGSQVEIKQVKLDVGQTQKYNLYAPEGTYSISVSDGATPEVLGNTFLTGNAIKVTDLKEDIVDTALSPVIWWLAISLIVLIIILTRVNAKLNRSKLGIPSNSEIKQKISDTKPVQINSKKEDAEISLPKQVSLKEVMEQEKIRMVAPNETRGMIQKTDAQTLFRTNETSLREKSSVLALRIGAGSNTPSANGLINSALAHAQEHGAKVYVDGEFRIMLFAPRLTKVNNNEELAVKTSTHIERIFAQGLGAEKMIWGMGINNGEIISETDNGKFHFTSVGNLVIGAKRASQSAVNKIYLTDSAKRFVGTTIKTTPASGQGLHELTKVVDRNQSVDFMNRFKSRNF